MKKLFLILTALLLATLMATALADTINDPGAGKPTVEMPANESFDNPATLVPGTFYRGEMNVAYQLAFTPPVDGTYTVYVKTDGEDEFSIKILDEYKNEIGWFFGNDKTRIPKERNVELEAGKTYHFCGTLYASRWCYGAFTFAMYPTDYSTGSVGMPVMEFFDNPCRIKMDIRYKGFAYTTYKMVFIPDISGTYLVYGETDNTKSLQFSIIDKNKQSIGWSFDNDSKMGPIYRAVEMTAGEAYYFVGSQWNGRWCESGFSFSLSYVDESETERIMSAMTLFNNPAYIKENTKYQGTYNTSYKQVFVPEKDGLYTVTITTSDTYEVNIKVIDQYKQDIGWSMNNGGIKGTQYKNILLKAENEYYFIGTRYNEVWSTGAFTFSITPAAGETANLLPIRQQYNNPAPLEAGILYRGDAGDLYEMIFTPVETGPYSIYAKTDADKDFAVKILDEYKESIGWKMDNRGKQTPVVSSVELEAGKEYHFTGDLWGAVWGNARFEFAICAPSKHAGGLTDFQTVQEPTCTEAGISAQLCTLCQQPVNSQEIPATGHTPGDPVIHQHPTCVDKGVKITQCAVCGEELNREDIPATGHASGEPVVYQQPTCVTDGLKVTQCTVCGAEVARETIPATGHTPGEPIVYQKATCLAAGLQITQCTVCGAEVAREELPIIDHQPGAWEELKPATCTTDGQRVQRCTVCHTDLARETIPATGHTPGTWEELKPATCTADGQRVQRCAVCGETLNSETVPAFGHSPMEWQITREATCLQSGLKEKKCSVCGVSLDQEEIPALGHSYTEWVTTIEATKDAEGERTRHCIHCGDTQHEAIEKVSRFLGIF